MCCAVVPGMAHFSWYPKEVYVVPGMAHLVGDPIGMYVLPGMAHPGHCLGGVYVLPGMAHPGHCLGGVYVVPAMAHTPQLMYTTWPCCVSRHVASATHIHYPLGIRTGPGINSTVGSSSTSYC